MLASWWDDANDGRQVDLGSRVVKREAAEEWCAKNGAMPYFETSAKDNINVEKVARRL